jgi:hypothetical protein
MRTGWFATDSFGTDLTEQQPMGRYRKIDVRVWNDAKFRGMSDRGKLAFFFMLTHPNMTSLGAMRATINGLSAEIGWGEKAFREAFQESSERGMCIVDETACFLWLPNFLKYNGPESPNVVRSWADCIDLLPECTLKDQLLFRVKGFTEGLSEAFTKALPEAFAKSMPNQEHEQEQEQEQDIRGAAEVVKKPKTKASKPENYSPEFLKFWEVFPPIRKTKKPPTWKAWKTAIAIAGDAQTIIDAAAEFAATPMGKGEYCPGPEPWLNKCRWEDDRSAWQVGDGKTPVPVSRVPTQEDYDNWSPYGDAT